MPIDSKTAQAWLSQELHGLSGISLKPSDFSQNLFELGLDSLVLIQLRERLQKRFRLAISMGQFYAGLSTLQALIDYVATEGSEDRQEALTPRKPASESISATQIMRNESDTAPNPMEQVILTQLDVMRAQLQAFSQVPQRCDTDPGQPTASQDITLHHAPMRRIKTESDELTDQQHLFLEGFIQRYVKKTASSRIYAQNAREGLADWIGTLAYRHSLKEITYPVVAAHSQGARFTDIDGNEYIDTGMGYGALFFGHGAPYIVEAIGNQAQKGFELAPQTLLAHEVAEIIRELTGVERVCFSNTGTEAVMAAMRIARGVSGRPKIVKFKGSFHGTFDGVLGSDDGTGMIPSSQGTTSGMVADLIELNYGSDEALEIIARQASEIAGVLVEPVQSRRPSFQPVQFLKKLRQITEEHQIALIFDEMITGFRIHPAGAQGYFGIQADIVTYGKVVGGGMPIGIVAGSSAYLDAIDGGAWAYGDETYPKAEMVTFGGTFCKHPLSLAAAKAGLLHLKTHGPKLQEALNEKTARFAEGLNRFFEDLSVPVRVHHFGSFFRFESFGAYALALQPLEMDLLFYLVMEKGIYTWEKRIGFFSLAHSDEEIALVTKAYREATQELLANGFFANAQPAHSSSVFPVTSPQRRLYALSQMEGGEKAYLMPLAWEIEGALNLDRAKEAFNAILSRHDALRTRFAFQDDILMQEVLAPDVVTLPFIHETSDQSRDLFIESMLSPFDLHEAPLLRIGVLGLAPQHHLLVMVSHHTVFDGPSADILLTEWAALYRQEQLSILEIEYRAYAEWYGPFLKSHNVRAQGVFWASRFVSPPPPLELPCDFPRPPVRHFQGAVFGSTIQTELSCKLRETAQKQGVTLNILLLAAFYLLLHRLSRASDLAVGTPVAGRQHGAYSQTIGMFANTLALRTDINPEESLSTFLKRLGQETFDAYDHLDYPLEELIAKLDLPRDQARNPLFDVMFTYEEGGARIPKIPELEFQPYLLKDKNAAFDLVLEVIEENGLLQLHLEYDRELFREETIANWTAYYVRILEQAAESCDSRLESFELVSKEERELMLRQFCTHSLTRTDTELLHGLFSLQAQKTPDAIVIQTENSRLSYRELEERSNGIAHALQTRFALQPDDRVAVRMPRSEKTLIVLLAILKAGAAYIPLEPSQPQDRIQTILKDSQAKAMIVEEKDNGLNEIETVRFSEFDGIQETVAPKTETTGEHLAYLIYTSGSTGTPKGVMISHDSLCNYLRWAVQTYCPEGGRFAWYTPLSFDLTVTTLYVPLLSGGSLRIFLSEMDDTEALRTCFEAKDGIDTVKMTPSHIRALGLMELPETAIQRVIVGGEALLREHIHVLRRLNPEIRIYNEYGPTEATVGCVMAEIGSDEEPILIGKPIAGMRAWVLDEQKRPTPPGVPGELWLGGIGLTRGYLNRPELNQASFVSDPFVSGEKMYQSGDLAIWRQDGSLEYLGRIDEQLKIRGYRIEPGEIETALAAHPDIETAAIHACLIGNDRELVAYLVGASLPSHEELWAFLSKTLSQYMIPAYFVPMRELPLTPNGKLDRKALPLPSEKSTTEKLKKEEAYVSARNDREKVLLEVLEEVLGRNGIGMKDHYFMLGGDSIKAIQVVGRLRSQGYQLTVRDIFREPVLESLALLLKTEQPDDAPEAYVGEAPMLPMQQWFFDRFGPEVHYNQSLLLLAQTRLNPEMVEQALQFLLQRHEMLRSRFLSSGKQEILPEVKIGLELVELQDIEQDKAVLQHHAAHAQQTFNLVQAPLLKAILFRCKDQDRLLLIAHHLIIDAISWLHLISELETVLKALEIGAEPRLPSVACTARTWTEALREYTKGPKADEERSYWHHITKQEFADPFLGAALSDFGDVTQKEVVLDLNETEQLLHLIHHAYHTDVQDFLVAALCEALVENSSSSGLLLALEGHGRERLTDAQPDPTQAIGWLTALYPLAVPFSRSDSPALKIKKTKEAIRNVPSQGCGYGALRYLSEKTDSALPSIPRTLLNYLGELDGGIGEQFALEINSQMDEVSPQAKRPFAFELEAFVLGKQMHLRFLASHGVLEKEELSHLSNRYSQSLRDLMAHCLAQEAGELTPGDFSADVSLDEWEEMFGDGD